MDNVIADAPTIAVLTVLGGLAEYERDLIRERVKARGVKIKLGEDSATLRIVEGILRVCRATKVTSSER